MKRNMPDILFTYPNQIPDELIFDEISHIESENLNIKFEKISNEPYASFEWIIPTAFIVYIFKPYFEGFLSEAGKDHYQLLKKGLKKYVEKGKLVNVKLVAATHSTQKISNVYNQSLTISFIIQIKDETFIKILFGNDLEKNDWDNGIEQLLDLVIENYEQFPNDRLSEQIKEVNVKNRKMIYAKINPVTKLVEIKSDNELFIEFKQNHS